jgi:hypothetical protein
MRMRTFFIPVILAGGCLAQNQPAKAGGEPDAEPRYFHLDFVVKEVEGGKIINARAYSMTVGTDRGKTSVRSGNRVPVPSGQPGNALASTQFHYVDVGTNIDCWDAKIVQGQLTLMVIAEVSSAATAPDVPAPVIRQVKWNAPAVVALRKPAIIFSSDDPTSKRQMQLELTATPIK